MPCAALFGGAPLKGRVRGGSSQVSALIPEFAPIVVFNMVVLCIFTVCLTYQAFYVLVGIFRKPKHYEASTQHRFAAISCGRNEAGVNEDRELAMQGGGGL